MKKTKIVCTIGPATLEVEVLKNLIKAGMNVARINFSHGSYEEQKKYIDAVKQAREEVGLPVALLLDTQGPEIRTGKLEENPTILEVGQKFVLCQDDFVGNKERVSVTYKDLAKDLHVGNIVLIDDGKLELQVEKIENNDVYCVVTAGGALGNRKSINIPGVHINLPALKEKDIKDLIDGCHVDFDYVAASFVRNANDVLEIRKVLDENGGKRIKIISKIENQEGIDNFQEILKVTDGVMVARGDLGVEIPIEEVPVVQKKMIRDCRRAGKMVITATQMLESMTESPRPTRAEVSDVANAIYDITGAVMLSGESATGKHPVECVEMMTRIAMAVESNLHYTKRFRAALCEEYDSDYEFKLNHAICDTAIHMKAKAIVAFTEKGDTPNILSGFNLDCPIYAVTKNEKTYRQLALVWNVQPHLITEGESAKEVISNGIDVLKAEGLLEEGDVVMVAGGTAVLEDHTASLMNRTIGGVLKL